jgi:hypothetical protein
MKYQSSLSHHYSPGHSSLQFSIFSTDGLLDEETIRTAYRMVSSILVNAAVAHASSTRKATHTAQTYRDERVPLDSACSETICKTVHANGIPKLELVGASSTHETMG